jgi:hypothetical protein
MIVRWGLITLVIAGGAGWLGWTAAPPSPVVAEAPPTVAPPVSAPRAPANPGQALDWLAARDPWDMRKPPPAPPAPPPPVVVAPPIPPWRLAGIVRQGGELTALLVIGPAPGVREYRKRGERLPDGGRIVEIAPGALTVDLGGERRQLVPGAGRAGP